MELTQELSTLCQEIWNHLNQVNLQPLPRRWSAERSSLVHTDVLRCFAEEACTKIIDLSIISDEDSAYVANLGISKAQLIRNLKETLDHRHFDPLSFQLDAVRRRSLTVFCPFTGKPVRSDQSLLANINVMFYRFCSDQVFYLAVAGIGSGFRKSALYFPESDLVVTAGDSWGFQPDDLLELKARMVSSAQACHTYLSEVRHEPRKIAACLGFYHFAHHLWNELSGLDQLHRVGLLKEVDKFLVLREPLGPLEQIFPEVPGDRIERKDTTSDLFHEILEKGYFAVRIGESYLTRELASRVAEVSAKNCNPETLALAAHAKQTHQPLLWVGIRVGNRAWADQVDGLTQIITRLQAQFPTLGVVFDGFSLPADRTAHSGEELGYADILAQENAIVQAIVENLRQRQVSAGIFNIIGLSIFDANVWAHAIDVYISPHGSLQHKVGWFTNKHGIVHTNRTMLHNPAKYIWEAVEGGIPPRYIDTASVTDVDSEGDERIFYNQISDANETGAGTQATNKRSRQNPEFVNYSIQWQDMHDEVMDLIRLPKIKPRMAALVFAHRMRRRMWFARRGIMRVFR